MENGNNAYKNSYIEIGILFKIYRFLLLVSRNGFPLTFIYNTIQRPSKHGARTSQNHYLCCRSKCHHLLIKNYVTKGTFNLKKYISSTMIVIMTIRSHRYDISYRYIEQMVEYHRVLIQQEKFGYEITGVKCWVLDFTGKIVIQG